MKKYVRGIICVIYTNIKFILIKIFHYNNFYFSALAVFSPFTEIDLTGSSTLFIGNKVRARSGTKIKVRNHASLKIGDNISFNHGCMIVSRKEIIIGNDVQFGPNVLVFDHDHDFRANNGLKNQKYVTESIEIGDNVWIGANVVILKGSHIGKNSIIGAGSVVNGEYPENSLIIQKRDTRVIALNTVFD